MPGPHEHLDHPDRIIADAFAAHLRHDSPVVKVTPLEAGQMSITALSDAGLVVLRDQPDHFITFDESGWFVEHSIACRVAGTIGTCEYNEAARHVEARGIDPEANQGRWRIVAIDNDGRLLLERASG